MFTFNFTLSEEDYSLFNQYYFLHSANGKKTLLLLRCLIPIICLAFILAFVLLKSDPVLIIIEAVLMAVLSVLWLVFSKKIMLKSIVRNIKKLKKDGRPPYGTEEKLIFDNDGMVEISAGVESKVAYTLIEKTAVTEKAVYIYISSIQAGILPMRVFSNEDEKQRFLEFLCSKIHKEAV